MTAATLVHSRQSVLKVILASLMVALAAQVEIYLPFNPVPLTLETLAVMFVGMTLGSKKGMAAILLYICEVAMGMPFLAGCKGGMACLIGPTGGYIAGFVVQAYFVGLFFEKFTSPSRFMTMLALSLSGCLTLAIGSLWLAQFVGWQQILPLGFYPFIPGDLLKALALAVFKKK